jgi:NTP pyrophosphatase (non-canonical NTP hydrolase)|tara:strand:+ start:270 stop:626 length:357 start_codon:yes stop_codon:yes gene_type:complete
MKKNMKYEQLQEKAIQWANDRNIFENSDATKQISKTQEELDETLDALKKLDLYKKSDNQLIRSEIMNEVADGIGDMLVTIILLAKMVNLDTVDCLAAAYDEIKDRKGKMVDGLFVKEK